MLIKHRFSTRARFPARLMAVLAASTSIAMNAADITMVTDADSGIGSLRQAMRSQGIEFSSTRFVGIEEFTEQYCTGLLRSFIRETAFWTVHHVPPRSVATRVMLVRCIRASEAIDGVACLRLWTWPDFSYGFAKWTDFSSRASSLTTSDRIRLELQARHGCTPQVTE